MQHNIDHKELHCNYVLFINVSRQNSCIYIALGSWDVTHLIFSGWELSHKTSMLYKAQQWMMQRIDTATFWSQTYIQPLVNQGLHVLLHHLSVTLRNLLQFNHQLFSFTGKLVQFMLLASHLNLQRLVLQIKTTNLLSILMTNDKDKKTELRYSFLQNCEMLIWPDLG